MGVIVTQGGKNARRVEPGEIPLESFLQKYIVDNPEALPLSDLRQDLAFLVVGREFPTASGPIDAVGLDDEGNFYLIETKLYRNPDKRQVLAQVLDYGAALWKRHGDADSFRSRLEEAARRTLRADLREKISDVFSMDLESVDALLATTETQVAEGRFRFVVLMDRIDDRLRDLIGFINENSRFDVYGVELQFYRFDGYEVTIPKLHGAEARKEVGGGDDGTRRTWNNSSYFEDAERRLAPAYVAALRKLYDFASTHADTVTWGTGQFAGSFNLKYDRLHPTKSLITVYSHGRLDLNFKWLHAADEPLPPEAQRLAKAFLQLEGCDLPAHYADTYPRIDVKAWAPQVDGVIEALQQAFAPVEGEL